MSESTPSDPLQLPPDELFCWRDATRICDATCVAYEKLSGPEYRLASKCSLINDKKALVRHLQRIAENVKR